MEIAIDTMCSVIMLAATIVVLSRTIRKSTFTQLPGKVRVTLGMNLVMQIACFCLMVEILTNDGKGWGEINVNKGTRILLALSMILWVGI